MPLLSPPVGLNRIANDYTIAVVAFALNHNPAELV
jgi:hypothetical protein